MNFPIIKTTKVSGRIFIFLIITLFGFLLGNLVSIAIKLVASDIDETTYLYLAQASSQIFGFIFPPLFYALLVRDAPLNSLGIKKMPSWAWLGIVAMFSVLPFNGMLGEWNERLSFPESMRSIELIFRDLQDKATQISEQMLCSSSVGGLVINLLIFGVFAATGEELFFRSILQKGFIRIFKNAHIGIIATALFFSASHLEIYGLLPRFVLGLLLGYMFYLSGSIWTSIAMHFANNATIVVLYFLNNRSIIDINVETAGSTDNIFIIIASLIVTFAIILLCNRFRKREMLEKQQH
ncbi:MAG: lysostaphin resistance A-like protein [Candidatus Limimorpha sp.]